jgi:polysaccharide biosynthesis transport protein
MEIRTYLLLLRKWAWLLILGTVVGGVASFAYSLSQPTIYQTSTRIMVSRSQEQDNPYYNAYNDIQLAQSYSQILNTQKIMQNLSAKLGYPVGSSQISVKQITDSQVIVLSVIDGDPKKAAEIANSLVEVFINNNQSNQDARYQKTENSLKEQIAKVEAQIATLQTDMSQVKESSLETQKQQIEEQSKQIENMLTAANNEVIQIETQLDTFIPTPAVTNTPNPSWIIPTATPVPVPTPTLSPADTVKYKELQTRRDQLNEMRTLFQQAYGNLLVLKQQSNTDPALRQAQIQNTLALYQQIYSTLLTSYENIRLVRLRTTPNIEQIDIAPVPTQPIQPRPTRNALLGALSGLMAMSAVAFLIEYLDDTLKTPEDVTHRLHVPVIGLIGELDHRKNKKREIEPRVFVAENPLSPLTEAFRTLRTNLDFASVDKPIRTLIVTSAGPSEGKSTIAVNLAAVIAQGGRKAILLDADLRRPSIHRYLGIPNRSGLTNLFRNPKQLSEVINEFGNPPMSVITSGEQPPNPSELLASERMESILSELKELFDLVIIDTPPAIISDSIALSPKVDGVLIVIEPGGTRIGPAQVLMEQLQRAGARVVGVVLNPISRRSSHYYTKYGYYSSYYYYSRRYGDYYGADGKKRSSKNGKSDQEANQSPPGA